MSGWGRKVEARAQVTDYRNSCDVLVLEHVSDDVMKVGRLVMEDHDPGLVAEPTASLTIQAAQRLMDDLWYSGIRPSQVGTEGQLEATQRHLQDMRALAFDKLQVDKP